MTIIAQLSDIHIADGAPERTLGLRRALTALLDRPARPDCVVLSGDLTDHGRPSEYATLREELTGLPMPVLPLPGNHDDVAALLAAFPEVPAPNYARTVDGVRVVCCDSTIPGRVGGELSDPEWLDATLAQAPEAPTVVAMHHPPYPAGVGTVEEMAQARPERLAAVIARHPQVVRVIAGHVHAGSVSGFAGTVAVTCPSTFRQMYVDPVGEPAHSDAPPGLALHFVDGLTAVTHFRPVGESAVPIE